MRFAYRLTLKTLVLCLTSVCFAQTPAGKVPKAVQPLPQAAQHDPNDPASAARQQLIELLDNGADTELAVRARAIAQIKTKAQAEARQVEVRERILHLIGGLPSERTPLNAQSLGVWQGDGFRIERIIFDSQPDFHVTADLYLPDGSGFKAPYPAVIDTPGHSPNGKLDEYQFAGNFARNGIAVLAYDPLGQGERLQYFDPATGKSKVGGPTREHGEASVQTMLLGEHISRYFVWDAMRALDYLQTRGDIQPKRIGAFGCSGGGTDTAYFAALDPRVQAAGVACYITSFHELLPSKGPQDAEQSIPGFISDGLDFPDWVELFAPKPYAIVSTTQDMFPYAGATTSHEESKHFYTLMKAADSLQWIVGPGHHGNLKPITPNIITFFAHALGNSDAPKPELVQLKPAPDSALLCTKTGQVSTSLGGETVYSINKDRVGKLLDHRVKPTAAQLRASVVELTRAGTIAPTHKPIQNLISTEEHQGYRLQRLTLTEPSALDTAVKPSPDASEIILPALLSMPTAPGKHPVTLVLNANPSASQLSALSPADHVILILGVRPSPPVGADEKKPELLDSFYLLSLRAMLTGKTLLGMRMDDVTTALNGLCSQPYADCKNISAQASGAYGIVLLYDALLDPRLAHITVDHALDSYKDAVDTELHQNISESMVPGVLRRYDLPDIVHALGKRVTITNPIGADGNVLP